MFLTACLSILFAVLYCIYQIDTTIYRGNCRRAAILEETDTGKALMLSSAGVLQTITSVSAVGCVQRCIANDQCKSINFRGNEVTQCQLLSFDKNTQGVVLNDATGWSHFEPREEAGSRCRQVTCKSGYKCVEKCNNGAGYECVETHSCFDWYTKGTSKNGNHLILDESGLPLSVYCDFTSKENFAWTLIMSFSYANNELYKIKDLAANFPRNESTPNWSDYRLPKSTMEKIKSVSSHFQATCSFQTYGFDGQDFVIAQLKKFDPFAVYTGQCAVVDKISIRGYGGVNITAPFYQYPGVILHTDSESTPCQFNATVGSVTSEDNFGYYGFQNPAFRCTEDQDSTTQYWLGRKVA